MVFSDDDDDDLFDEPPTSSSTPAPAPAPKKSSLFGPSKFARPAAKFSEEEEEALSIFSRRNEVFANVMRERQEAARKREYQRLKKEDKELGSTREGKKRRLSSDNENEGEKGQLRSPSRRKSSSAKSTPRKERTRSISIPDEENSRRSFPTQNNVAKPTVIAGQNRNPSATLISLDSDDDDIPIQKGSSIYPFDFGDDDEDLKPSKNTRVPSPDLKEDEAQLSEEEFPELVEAARRRQREQSMNDPSAPAKNLHLSPKPGRSSTSNSPQPHNFNGSTPDPDTAALILVTSTIPGTKPVVLKRKLAQRLKDVRLAWIDRQLVDGQPIGEPLRSNIFLTWRGIRIFDVTTCNSMGIKVGSDGRLEAYGDGFEGGQIYLQAWTQDLFDAWKKEKTASRQRRLAGPHDDETEAEPTAKEIAAREAEAASKFKIILKAKDYEDCKLFVRPVTRFEKLVSVFRKHHNLGDKTVQLFFDGDAVDPQTTMEEAGLEDMDVIDVHL